VDTYARVFMGSSIPHGVDEVRVGLIAHLVENKHDLLSIEAEGTRHRRENVSGGVPIVGLLGVEVVKKGANLVCASDPKWSKSCKLIADIDPPNFCAKTGGIKTMKIGPQVAYCLGFEGLEIGGMPP
jgi:hypothetical protein